MEFHTEGARLSVTRMMGWCTVLLEYVSVTSSGTNGWQHLLRQYDAYPMYLGVLVKGEDFAR